MATGTVKWFTRWRQIQLKFRFEGEYFHYSGDLFFIYKSGHLMKLTCQRRENVGLGLSGRLDQWK